jgi:hypothetical protein
LYRLDVRRIGREIGKESPAERLGQITVLNQQRQGLHHVPSNDHIQGLLQFPQRPRGTNGTWGEDDAEMSRPLDALLDLLDQRATDGDFGRVNPYLLNAKLLQRAAESSDEWRVSMVVDQKQTIKAIWPHL